MAFSVRSVEYFYTRVEDEPGNAYELLAQLASKEVNLLAFSAVPYGSDQVELTIFPEQSDNLLRTGEENGWILTGPQHACLIEGDDQLRALALVHKTLLDAGVQIYASSGVADSTGRFGYVIYFKEGDHAAAADALDSLR